MPTFKNNSAVCHAFASRQHTDGKCGNIYFDADTIYSYGPHFPMAKFHNGDSFILITTEGYSNSTAKHMSLLRSAVNHVATVYVDNVAPSCIADHRKNIAGLLATARDKAGEWQRSRKYKDMLSRTIRETMSDVSRYLEAFKLKPVKATREAIEAFAPVLDVPGNEHHEAKQAEAMSEFIAWLLGWSEEVKEKQAAKRKRDAVKLEQRRAIEREQAAKREKEAAILKPNDVVAIVARSLPVNW